MKSAERLHNVDGVAIELGVPKRTLYYRMKQWKYHDITCAL